MHAKTQPTPPEIRPVHTVNDDLKAPDDVVKRSGMGEEVELNESLIRLQDGAVILDRDGAHRYVTRYHINHKLQRAHGMKNACVEEFIPCCDMEPEPGGSKRKRAVNVLWQVLRSEVLLLSLHVLVLILGVSKEALNLREVDEDLHLTHSIVETLVTVLQIVIRTINGWTSFRLLVTTAYGLEHVEKARSVRGRHMRYQLWGVTVLGMLLVVIAIACFLAFYWLSHLGWTILSNNFVLVVITVTSNLYQTRLDKNVWQIREDQHKAVLYETILILGEVSAVKTPEDMRNGSQKLSRFIKALTLTGMFDKPPHIMEEENMSHADALLSMEMQYSA